MKRNDDRGTVRVVSTESLLSISRAWLTVYCHKVCGYEWGLKRPVANWFVNRLGASSFSADISYFTRYGIASRAAWFVAQLEAILITSASQNERVVIWALVAGLDSRRQWIMHESCDANRLPRVLLWKTVFGKGRDPKRLTMAKPMGICPEARGGPVCHWHRGFFPI